MLVPNTNVRGLVWKEKWKDSKTKLNNENGLCFWFPLFAVLLFLKWGSFPPQTPRLFCGHVNMLASILVLHFDFWDGAVLLACSSSGKTRRRIALCRSVGMCNFEKEKTWKREGLGEAAHRLFCKEPKTIKRDHLTLTFQKQRKNKTMETNHPKDRLDDARRPQKQKGPKGIPTEAPSSFCEYQCRPEIGSSAHRISRKIPQLREMSWNDFSKPHVSIAVTKPFFGAKKRIPGRNLETQKKLPKVRDVCQGTNGKQRPRCSHQNYSEAPLYIAFRENEFCKWESIVEIRRGFKEKYKRIASSTDVRTPNSGKCHFPSDPRRGKSNKFCQREFDYFQFGAISENPAPLDPDFLKRKYNHKHSKLSLNHQHFFWRRFLFKNYPKCLLGKSHTTQCQFSTLFIISKALWRPPTPGPTRSWIGCLPPKQMSSIDVLPNYVKVGS